MDLMRRFPVFRSVQQPGPVRARFVVLLFAQTTTRKLDVFFMDTSSSNRNTPLVGDDVFVRPTSGMDADSKTV